MTLRGAQHALQPSGCTMREAWCALVCCRPGQSSPGTSRSPHSSSVGGTPPRSAAAAPHLSTDLGRRGSHSFAPASPLARALSGMAASIQRGVSGAGEAVARTLSGTGGRPLLSTHSSAGYERLAEDRGEAGGGFDDMGAVPAAQSPQSPGPRSMLGPERDPQQMHAHVHPQQPALHPSRFFLPGVSALPHAAASQSGQAASLTGRGPPWASRPDSPSGQHGPGGSQGQPAGATGWGRPVPVPVPVPGAALLQGVGPDSGPDGGPGGGPGGGPDGLPLPRPMGLARIRTRPKESSGTGGLQLGQGGPGDQVPGSQLEGLHVHTAGDAGAPAGQVPGSGRGSLAPGSAGDGSSSSRTWRTREQYQADLVASSSPVVVPRQVMQASRAPSEPGALAAHRVRRQAGLDFVQTPTATDGTNR
jgi:hypothetical protein